MMNVKSANYEMVCENIFRNLGPVYNANTSENHPLIFVSEDDFKAGMTILAICARMHADIKVYAFQLMSNHIHLVIGGEPQRIQVFFKYYVDRLNKFFDGRNVLNDMTLKLFPVNDLSYLRNAIAYVNRNGFVVNNSFTPFSYPWGSSPYFFQPMAGRYVKLAGKSIGNASLRALMHTKASDKFHCLKIVDGFVSPLEFLDIETAESIFRDAKQYFYLISRKVESYSEVAKSIGEAMYYNDNDLYMAAMKISIESYNCRDPKILPAAQKIELARRLYFDYNAGEKQLQRLISIDANLLKAVL